MEGTAEVGGVGRVGGVGKAWGVEGTEDDELARRSVASFGEVLTVVGRWGVGPGAVIRRPDAVGAHIPDVGANPWFDAVVVPFGAPPPGRDDALPYCIWTAAERVAGRTEDPSIAMPCMGLDLTGPRPAGWSGPITVDVPPLAEVGDMNDRAYGVDTVFGPLAARIADDRVATVGIRSDGRFVCVAVTLTLGDDLGIHYVATESTHRRRGLATALLSTVLDRAAADGLHTATLQASPDGRPVYLRMGFRPVTLLRGFVRPTAGQAGDDRTGVGPGD
jgi:GNAT superfamily N-acetyltransferase